MRRRLTFVWSQERDAIDTVLFGKEGTIHLLRVGTLWNKGSGHVTITLKIELDWRGLPLVETRSTRKLQGQSDCPPVLIYQTIVKRDTWERCYNPVHRLPSQKRPTGTRTWFYPVVLRWGGGLTSREWVLYSPDRKSCNEGAKRGVGGSSVRQLQVPQFYSDIFEKVCFYIKIILHLTCKVKSHKSGVESSVSYKIFVTGQ